MPKYKRILLKISGEALKGKEDIYDKEYLESIYKIVQEIVSAGTEVFLDLAAVRRKTLLSFFLGCFFLIQ